jgi:hypothetical protein
MSVIFGSARHDENGRYANGKAGDQTGSEVSTQVFYMHPKGWYALRAKDANLANRIAEGMKIACANNNIGYDQNERNGVVVHGIQTTRRTETDCSALIRAVLKWAGVNVGNFTTANEKRVLMNTGLFDCYTITSASQCCTGDILVTKTKGHTVIVVDGAKRSSGKVALPVLKKSVMKNAEAKKLQKNLNSLGYKDFDGKKLVKDGVFGSRTESALKDFQVHEKLTVDGIYGEKSYNAMCKRID